jgi:hypothetical protein
MSGLDSGEVLAVMLLGILPTVFWIMALVDVVRREFRHQNDKVVWVLVICLGSWLGAIVYFAFGREMGWMPGRKPAPPPDAS